MCRNLTRLQLSWNDLSDMFKDHIAMVVRNNCASLEDLDTRYNQFTRVDNTGIHSNTHLCRHLDSLYMGGSVCTDINVNISTLSSILPACLNLSLIGLLGYSLDVDGLGQIHSLLSSRHLVGLILDENKLTAECIPVLNLILAKHR